MTETHRNGSPLMDRREFLKRGGEASIAMAAAVPLIQNPHVDILKAAASWLLRLRERGPEQIASEMILSRRQGWSSPDWWPIFEKTALKKELPRIHDNWWPAHVFDMEYRAAGGSSNIQEQAINKADFIMQNRPETEAFAGYCPWLAAAQATEEQPVSFPGETLGWETDLERIVRLKIGLLTIKHAGDTLVATRPTGKNLITLVQSGFPTIVDLPDRLGVGQWFRCVQGVSEDGELVRVTNFGYPDVELPVSGIRSAWRVHPAESTNVFASGIREDTEFWRFDNLDRSFIDRLVYRK